MAARGTDRVADALRARLQRNHADIGAYRELKAHYRAREQFSSLYNLLVGWAKFTRDPRERAEALREAGGVASGPLGDAQRGIEHFRKALHYSPLDVDALEGLQRLLEHTGNHEALIEFLQDHLRAMTDHGAPRGELALVRYKLGELWTHRFESPDEGLHQYSKAFELDPTLLRAAFEARQICLSTGRMREAADLYEQEASGEADAPRRAALLAELAALYGEDLGDVDGAISAMERACRALPDDAELLHMLVTWLSHRAEQGEGDLAGADRRRIADALCRLAALVGPEEAAVFLESALDHQPGHLKAMEGLERALQGGDAEERLAGRWLGFVQYAPEGTALHVRRVYLARAYASHGQLEDARYCLQPALDQGLPDALVLSRELDRKGGSGPGREEAPVSESAHSEERASSLHSDVTDADDSGQFAALRASEESRARRRRVSEVREEPLDEDSSDEHTVMADPSELEDLQRRSDPKSGLHDDVTVVSTTPEQMDAPPALPRRKPTAAPRKTKRGAKQPRSTREMGTDQLAAARAASQPPPPSAQGLAEDAAVALRQDAASAPADDAESSIQPAAESSDAEALVEPTATADEAEEAVGAPAAPADEDGLSALRREAEGHVRSRNPDAAAVCFERILDSAPDDGGAFNFLDTHYRRARDHQRRMQLMLRSGQSEGVPQKKRVLHLREAASLAETRLRDPNAAARIWRMLMKLEPQQEEPRRNLKRLLERAKRWEDLLESLSQEAEEASGDARLELLRRMIGIHRDQRKDPDAALPLMREVWEADPDDTATRDALCELLLDKEYDDEAIPLLQARVAEAKSRSQRLQLLRRLAVAHEAIDDIDGAHAAHAELLSLSPRDTDTLQRMAELDERAGNFERLLETLGKQLEIASKVQAPSLYLRMASVAESDMLDGQRAVELLTTALDATPDNDEVLAALCETCERAGQHEQLADLLLARAGKARKAARKVSLMRRAARVLAEPLERMDAAADAWRSVLTHTEDPEGLAFIASHARARGAHDELADALGRAASLDAEPDALVDMLVEQASLLTGPLGKPAEALAPLARVLETLDPEHTGALQLLAEASTAADQYEVLARTLEARLARTEVGPDALESAQQLADLYEGPLADPKAARRALQAWAAADPGSPAPLRRLRPLLEKQKGQHRALLKTLEALCELEDDEDTRTEATVAAARVLAGPMKDPDEAWERLYPCLPLARPDVDAALRDICAGTERMAALFDAYEGAGRYEELAKLLAGELPTAKDDATRIELLRRLAQLQAEQLADAGAAEATYDQLLSVKEDEEALRFIQIAAETRDDPARLVEVLPRLAAFADDDEARRELGLEQARLLSTRLDRAPDAIVVLEALIRRFGRGDGVLEEELLSACETAGDYTALARELEAQLAEAVDPDTRIGLSRRLADLYDNELSDEKRALRALRSWHEADPQDPDPLRRLRHRLEEGKPTPELLEVLDALAQTELDREAQLHAQVAAGVLCAEGLRDPEQAWERLSALVIEEFPPADGALQTLARKLGRIADYHALLEEYERYEDVAALLERDIADERDGARRSELRRRLGRIYADHLADMDAAEAQFNAILEDGEDAEALHFLHARAVRADDPRSMADILGRLAALEQDAEARRDLRFEQAHVLGSRLEKRDEAIAVLMDLLQTADPGFDAAIEELIALSEAEGDDVHLAEGLSRMIAREQRAEERADLARRLYTLRAGPLQDPAGAAQALTAWCEADPADPEPRRHLRPLLREAGDPAALLTCLDALIAGGDDDEVPGARLEAGKLCAEAGDVDGAWERLTPLVFSRDIEAETLLHDLSLAHGRMDALCDLYGEAGRHDDVVQLLRELAERSEDAETKAELFARCARLLGGPLGDEIAAGEAWQDVLEFREDVEGLTFLRGFHQRMDDVEALADVLGRLSNQLTEPQEQRELLFERALLLSDRLERPAEAISVLRYIVGELDPSFEAAVEELIVVCEGERDHEGLAAGLRRQLDLQADTPAAPGTARRLCELYEQELKDPAGLREALERWAMVDPDDAEPHRRLRPMFDARKDAKALQATLDALSTLEPEPDARHEAARSGALHTLEKLRDPEGAWRRIAPIIHVGDAEAEALGMRLARSDGYGTQLASIHVMRAQQARSGEEAAHHWGIAATIYDELLSDPAEALEAALRMFATDMEHEDYLATVERLAAKAKAWPRLGQVYARLQKQAPTAERQVELLVRQAKLLQDRARNIPGALKCVLDACKLAPSEDDIYAWAERLADEADGHAELQWIYERRAKTAKEPEERAQYLLRAARTADLHREDREQAMLYLREALEMTEEAPQAGPAIEDLVRELDRKRPELGKDDVRRSLIHAHLELAEERSEPFGPVLILRASQLLKDELRDEGGAYDALRRGATLFPADADILDALHDAARRIRRLDGLDAQLARMARDQEDQEIKLDLLMRRAEVLGTELGRHDGAARVYQEILALDPEAEGVTEALIDSLAHAGRPRELLKALEGLLERTDGRAERLGIMRRMAGLWENELRNRPAALGVWREVLDFAPDDDEAQAALERLSA